MKDYAEDRIAYHRLNCIQKIGAPPPTPNKISNFSENIRILRCSRPKVYFVPDGIAFSVEQDFQYFKLFITELNFQKIKPFRLT
jgi:hypothetical protein